ncbi:uncharacterized protein LOC116258779 isoform X2 [Nymphaea colorata]|nr:uncharacterized protein LOC116258779 isoform X2 [Nymphaea colorata]
MDAIPLNDWEDVSGTPFPPSSDALPLQSPAPPRPLYDEKCCIFPPRDHEGLPIMAMHHPPSSDQPQAEPGRDEGEDGSGGDGTLFPQVRVRLLWARKVLSLAVRFLWWRIRKLYSILRGDWRFPVTLASFPMVPAGSALALAALLLLTTRQRYWRGVWRQNATLLLRIQEKDQEIRQLRLMLSQTKEAKLSVDGATHLGAILL